MSDLPFLGREVPVSDSPIAKILARENVDTTYDMAHHTVAYHDDLLEAAQDFTDFFRRKPTHVAASRHVGGVIANTTTRGHRRKHRLTIVAERSEWRVEIHRGDVAGITILVVGKGVDCVRRAVSKHLRRLEGGIWKDSRVIWGHLREVGWTSRLNAGELTSEGLR